MFYARYFAKTCCSACDSGGLFYLWKYRQCVQRTFSKMSTVALAQDRRPCSWQELISTAKRGRITLKRLQVQGGGALVPPT